MSSKHSLGVVATVVLMLSVGAAGAIWATASGGNSSVGDTARLVPADTAFYATVNTDPASRQWLQFGQILARLGVAGQLRDLRDQGSLLADLQWDDDIAPYLGGEATVAFGGLDGDRPDALVILATADGGRAWDHAVRLLDHRAQQRGVPPESRSYRGTTIRTYEEDGPARQLWIARKDRYLMIGTAPSGADAVLDVAAGRGATLAGLDRFRAARAAVTDDSLLFAYMNPAALGDLAGTLGSSLVPGATTETLAAAGWENAAVALAISAER